MSVGRLGFVFGSLLGSGVHRVSGAGVGAVKVGIDMSVLDGEPSGTGVR
jgi:hypothetical protein